jgi:hypothetical protein
MCQMKVDFSFELGSLQILNLVHNYVFQPLSKLKWYCCWLSLRKHKWIHLPPLRQVLTFQNSFHRKILIYDFECRKFRMIWEQLINRFYHLRWSRDFEISSFWLFYDTFFYKSCLEARKNYFRYFENIKLYLKSNHYIISFLRRQKFSNQ